MVVEGAPRKRKANKAVARELGQRTGIGFGFHKFKPPKWLGEAKPKPHLRSKIYVFSHPEPHVLIGSFNPSGNGVDDDPKIIEAIGDQDQGHNLLVEIHDRVIVKAMRRQVSRLRWLGWHALARNHPEHQRVFAGDDIRAWIFPRRRPGAIEPLFTMLGEGDRLRVAMSHIKTEHGLDLLCGAAKRGVQLHVILHHTHRRAPIETEDALRKAGADVLRYRHPLELPMHAKFMLMDRPSDPGSRVYSTYGSLNLNERSLLINHEVFVQDHCRDVFAQLEDRWNLIEAECRTQCDESPKLADPPEEA